MKVPRLRAGRRTIGLLVAVLVVVAATWANVAVAAGSKPARAPTAKVMSLVGVKAKRQKPAAAFHDGQCPFRGDRVYAPDSAV
jgi:hypothetical protein